MTTIGMMKMPGDFKYEKVHRMGRPRHAKYSGFWRKHIPMDRAHRAKQFAPFDALDGFDEAILAKETVYVERQKAYEDELNRKLTILRHHKVPVTITYFVPCADPENDAFEKGWGQYRTATGIVWNMNLETQTLQIQALSIRFEDIMDIDFDKGAAGKSTDPGKTEMR